MGKLLRKGGGINIYRDCYKMFLALMECMGLKKCRDKLTYKWNTEIGLLTNLGVCKMPD